MSSTPELRQHNNAISRWLVPALIVAGTITGCEPLDRPTPGPVAVPGESVAAALSARGEFRAAESAYREFAGRTSGADAQRYLILAARELDRAGQTGAARSELGKIAESLAPANEDIWLVATAETDLTKGDEAAAIRRLEQVSRRSGPVLLAETYRLLGEAYFRRAELVDGVAALSKRESLLSDPDAIGNNRRRIWTGLMRDEQSLASAIRAQPEDPTVAGWLSLAAVTIRARQSPAGLGSRLARWEESHPWHPAAGGFLAELRETLLVSIDYPAKVLLVLPLSGPQAAAGSAVRDGFLAAHFANESRPGRPEIEIVDVAANGIARAYEATRTDANTFVVGPLLKNSVGALAASGSRVPALALNFLPEDTPTPSGFFQFSLSPEDEARQAADRALRDGHRRALVLAPNSGWGRRLLTAFTSALDEVGGEVITYKFYDPGATDLSSTIESLLLLDESKARQRRLAANVRKDLEFEPRRRDDVELIFLAANSSAGRMIRPQLRFHYAADIPLYSTSSIYQVGAGGNRDLDGIMFPDMPWVVDPRHPSRKWREKIATLYPSRFASQDRLFAMGFDAYTLVPWLFERIGYLDRPIAGATGTLIMDEAGRIRRQLPWAIIRDGRAERMPWLPDLIETGHGSSDLR